MKTSIVWSAAVATMLACAGNTAHAAIVDNGTFTTDTATGLDWLDLTASLNMSREQVLDQSDQVGEQFYGWHYASFDEMKTLLTNFGIPPVENDIRAMPTTYAIGAALYQFTQLLGETFHVDEHYFGSTGLTGTPEPSGGYKLSSLFFFGTDDGALFDVIAIHVDDGGGGSAAPNIGSFLVRGVTPVPLPAAAWLMLSGLGALAVVAGKRRRSAQQLLAPV